MTATEAAPEVFTPSSLADAAAVLKDLSARKARVAIAGGGTAVELGNSAEALDAIVSTARLNRIVEYAPADQVVTAEAGMTLRSLQEQLLPNRQRLAIDPPRPARATLGGIVATNAYGPRRLRYGTVKDLIVGMTIVRPDGTIARGGGKVVKNVAGFDIPKLMVGSLGTLALIANVTFRLHPLPEAERALRFQGCTPDATRALVNEAIAAQLEPSMVYALWIAGAYMLCMRFEGFGAGVDAQIAALSGIAQRCGLRAEELGPVDWAPLDVAHDAARIEGALRIKLTTLPSHLPQTHERIIAPLLASLSDARCALYPALGIAFISGEPSGKRIVELLREARSRVEREGGTLILTAAPATVRERIDVWGTPPPSFPLMRELKARFDSERRFNPGRFVGGL